MAHLEALSIRKAFGPVQAVRGASLSVVPGEIHALVGENGAGKSTLLKVAAGHIRPDDGGVTIDGSPLSPHTPSEALSRGVALVAQHFTLVGPFTVLENIILGVEPLARGVVDRAAARARIREIERRLALTLDLDARTDSLGVGARQRVEIVRALYRGSKVLLLDEPTAVLAKGEADALYQTLRRLANEGYAIVVTTHKLDEVIDHADVTTVMRQGEVVAVRRPNGGGGATVDSERVALTRAIMGGDPPPDVVRTRTVRGEESLVMRNVCRAGALRDLSLRVMAGEIVGMAGIEGNGQREIALILAGLLEPDSGTVKLSYGGGQPPTTAPPKAAVVHEDRQREGLVLSASVYENLILGELANYARFGVIDDGAARHAAEARHGAASIHPKSMDLPASALSGGNQQKIVVARALAKTEAPVLVLAHPTRGVDVGAAHAIHESILRAAANGKGVLVISSDLSELRSLSDRILVLSSGGIAGEFPPEADDFTLGQAMLGGAP